MSIFDVIKYVFTGNSGTCDGDSSNNGNCRHMVQYPDAHERYKSDRPTGRCVATHKEDPTSCAFVFGLPATCKQCSVKFKSLYQPK